MATIGMVGRNGRGQAAVRGRVDTSTTAKLIAATTTAMSAIAPSTLVERTRCFSLSDRPDPCVRMLWPARAAPTFPIPGVSGSVCHPLYPDLVPLSAVVHPRVAHRSSACEDCPQWTPCFWSRSSSRWPCSSISPTASMTRPTRWRPPSRPVRSSPRSAVAIAAILNLVGAFLSTEVAKTISGGLINEGDETASRSRPELILAGLIGAIVWNLITWLLGLPSSSSHALFGGLIGAAIVGAGIGVDRRRRAGVEDPHPRGARAAHRRSRRVPGDQDRVRDHPQTRTRRLQDRARSSPRSLVSLAHGTNDAQKTMGVITLALIAAGFQDGRLRPADLGHRRVRHRDRRSAPTPAAGASSRPSARTSPTSSRRRASPPRPRPTATILASSHLGFALSTTQVASGSVIGTGLGRKGASVRWRTAGRIALGWLITIPASGAGRRVRRLPRVVRHSGASSSTSCSPSSRSSRIFLLVASQPGRPPQPRTSPSRASSCARSAARKAPAR